jgi:hypothetical protein
MSLALISLLRASLNNSRMVRILNSRLFGINAPFGCLLLKDNKGALLSLKNQA